MTARDAGVSAEDLVDRRATVRRGLARASAASFLALLVIMVLALVAIRAAYRAEERALEARRATEQVWRDSALRARASRVNNALGGRQEGLDTLRAAAKFRATPSLRDEAISVLALGDFQDSQVFHDLPRAPHAVLSAMHDRVAYSTADHTLVVADLANGKETLRHRMPGGRFVFPIVFSPDDQFVAARNANGLKVWQHNHDRPILEIPCTLPRLQIGDSTLTFAPKGETIAYGTEEGQTFQVCVQEVASGSRVLTLEPGKRVHALAFSPDGRRLAVGMADLIKVWDFETERWKVLLENDEADLIRCLAWSPNGRFLAAGSHERWVFVSNTETGETQAFRGHAGAVETVCFHPDGDLIASGDGTGITRVCDHWSGHTHLVTDRGMALGFDPSGRRLAYGRRMEGVGFLDFTRSPVFRQLTLSQECRKRYPLVACHPNGKRVVLAVQDELIFLNVNGDLGTCQRLGSLSLTPPESTDPIAILSVATHPTSHGWQVVTDRGPAIVSYDGIPSSGEPPWHFCEWPDDLYLRGAQITALGSDFAAFTDDFYQAATMAMPSDTAPRLFRTKHVLSNAALSPNRKWLALGVGTWLRGAQVIDHASGQVDHDTWRIWQDHWLQPG